jgi:probable HAF family extracellular repeat protein
MQGLGFLAGENPTSAAAGISKDGNVVVGFSSRTVNGVYYTEAFRWTAEEGMIGLGDLSSGRGSEAFAVSNDGGIVVGLCRSVPNPVAFIWDKENGMRNLRTVIASEYGINLSEWNLLAAYSISADGTELSGGGRGPNLSQHGWAIRGLRPSDAGGSASLSLWQARPEAFVSSPADGIDAPIQLSPTVVRKRGL